jgi:hypothetical protein
VPQDRHTYSRGWPTIFDTTPAALTCRPVQRRLGTRPGHAITTLDNPGGTVTIELADTGLNPDSYPRREVHRSKDDWCVTWTESATFEAACGPTNLAEALHEFPSLDQHSSRLIGKWHREADAADGFRGRGGVPRRQPGNLMPRVTCQIRRVRRRFSQRVLNTCRFGIEPTCVLAIGLRWPTRLTIATPRSNSSGPTCDQGTTPPFTWTPC